MATIEAAPRPRDTLPSISHLDLDTVRGERNDLSRYSIGNGLSITTAPLASPTASMYSGPPQPYSCAPSTAGSTGVSGYISPPESTTRRSTRDEKESPDLRKSLPSIHEALGDKSLPFSGSSQHQSLPTPSTAVGPSFSDGPKGPVNPFSQPPPPVLRDVFSAPQMTASAPTEPQTSKPPFPQPSGSAVPDPRQPVSQAFGYPGSPGSQQPSNFRSSALANTTFTSHNETAPARSPQTYEQPRQQPAFPSFSNPASSNAPTSTSEPFQFTAGSKPANEVQYNEAVKRHLEVFDAELGLNEIGDSCLRTLDFCRTWGQRIHQGTRAGYPNNENMPPVPEAEEIMRHLHRAYELITYVRELSLAQESAKREERARLARGAPAEEEYQAASDEYKGGGYTGGDAKKRRGKAAPPGRCHSCNRAETPEWRRGPDGARTLCNACGLHYAKLTRKLGVNKAAAMTGANLRPKNADPTRP